MRFFPSALGSSLAFLALSVSPVVAGSSRDAALEACSLHPGCSVQELMVTCKGDTKCIIDTQNKRTERLTNTLNDSSNKAEKGIKNLFKKKHKHHKH